MDHPTVHVRAAFPYLGNGWSHCAEIYDVSRGTHQLSTAHKSWMGYQYLQEHNLGVILLNYGVLIKSLTVRFTNP